MKRFLIVTILIASLFSCEESATNKKEESGVILELDTEHVIRGNGVSLIPIVNKVAGKEVKLKGEMQKDNTLKLEFNVELEAEEELHCTINNGEVFKSENNRLELELLEGNNVVFVCLSNAAGIGSNFWVKNYFIGEGQGSFDRTDSHLFQHITENGKGLIIDYRIMNKEEGFYVVLQFDSLGYLLTPNITYLLQGKQPVRLQLMNSDGELIGGPFNDTGVIGVEVE